ncbi:MAG: glycosyltransferase family 2 protein, partial [Thermoanaerobaculia bacterium]
MANPRLSIIIPLFNEAENLEPLAAELAAALDDLDCAYEVLFVDDGSEDDSLAVLARLTAADPRLRVLRQPKNMGQSAAFAAGFRHARGELIATLDADLQNDPADLPRMLNELDRCDVVCGVRTDRHDSFVRRASSRIANSVRNRLTGESITDVGCSLRVMRARHARRVPMFDGMHRFLPTLLRMEGARISEVPVSHRPRLRGVSKYGIHNRLWRALADLFAVRWMQRRRIDRRAAVEVGDEPPPQPGA